MVGAPVWAMGGRKRKAETEEGQVRSGQQSRIGDLVTLVVVETLKRQHMHAVSRRSCGALETSRTTSVLGYCIHTIQSTLPLGETTRCLPLWPKRRLPSDYYSFYLPSLTPFDSYRHPYIRLFPGLEPCAVQQLLCSMHHLLTPLLPTIALVSPREPHWRALLVSVVLRMYRRHARTSQRLSSANTLSTNPALEHYQLNNCCLSTAF